MSLGWGYSPGGTRGLLGPLLGIAGGWWGDQEALLPTGALHPWPLVPSPPRSVGTWASGMYPVIRATQQAERGLREGAVEAAAACPAPGAKAGRLGRGVHCLASPPLASTGSAAAGSGLLAEAPSCSPHAGTPWPARPRLGLRPPWCGPCAGYCCCWPPGGTAWAPGETLQGEAGFGGLTLGLSGTQSTRMGQTGKRAEKRWSTGQVVGQVVGQGDPRLQRGELLQCQFCG